MNDAGLWMIISAVLSVLIVIELASRSVLKAHYEHQLRQVRVDYLNKVNNLPGDEAEYVRFMNAAWGAIYDDPNSWEYPDQIIRHVDQLGTEHAVLLQAVCSYMRAVLPIDRNGHYDFDIRRKNLTDLLTQINPGWDEPVTFKGIREALTTGKADRFDRKGPRS